MEWVRRTRAEHTHNVEEEEEIEVESANLENLEVKREESGEHFVHSRTGSPY